MEKEQIYGHAGKRHRSRGDERSERQAPEAEAHVIRGLSRRVGCVQSSECGTAHTYILLNSPGLKWILERVSSTIDAGVSYQMYLSHLLDSHQHIGLGVQARLWYGRLNKLRCALHIHTVVHNDQEETGAAETSVLWMENDTSAMQSCNARRYSAQVASW